MELRFYAKKKKDSKKVIFELINNPTGIVKNEFTAMELKMISTNVNFCEVRFEIVKGKVVVTEVHPLDVEFIHFEAFKAANDYNHDQINKSDPENQDYLVERKEIAQDVLDRCILYGDSFTTALENLFNDFPIMVSVDKEINLYRTAKI